MRAGLQYLDQYDWIEKAGLLDDVEWVIFEIWITFTWVALEV
jgi:hypothetical protein